jgi:hypothetical protein
MQGNDCRLVRREIDESELGQRLNPAVQAHLADCPACTQFQNDRLRLRELVGSLQPVAAPADFDMRLRARIAREKSARAQRPFIFRFAVSTPGVVVAALMVAMVAAAIWFTQSTRRALPAASVATTGQPPDQQKSPTTNVASSEVHNDKNNQSEQAGPQQTPQPVVVKRQNPQRQNVTRTNQMQVASQDFGSSRAPSFRLDPDRRGAVSLTAPDKPLVVTMQDEHGATRRILLPPVSFGWQRMDNRVPISMNNSRDW